MGKPLLVIFRKTSQCCRAVSFPLAGFICKRYLNNAMFHRYMMQKEGLRWFELISRIPETAMRGMPPDCFKEIGTQKLFALFYRGILT